MGCFKVRVCIDIFLRSVDWRSHYFYVVTTFVFCLYFVVVLLKSIYFSVLLQQSFCFCLFWIPLCANGWQDIWHLINYCLGALRKSPGIGAEWKYGNQWSLVFSLEMDQCCSICYWLTSAGAVLSDTWVGPCIVDMAYLTQRGGFEGVHVPHHWGHKTLASVKANITSNARALINGTDIITIV